MVIDMYMQIYVSSARELCIVIWYVFVNIIMCVYLLNYKIGYIYNWSGVDYGRI